MLFWKHLRARQFCGTFACTPVVQRMQARQRYRGYKHASGQASCPLLQEQLGSGGTCKHAHTHAHACLPSHTARRHVPHQAAAQLLALRAARTCCAATCRPAQTQCPGTAPAHTAMPTGCIDPANRLFSITSPLATPHFSKYTSLASHTSGCCPHQNAQVLTQPSLTSLHAQPPRSHTPCACALTGLPQPQSFAESRPLESPLLPPELRPAPAHMRAQTML